MESSGGMGLSEMILVLLALGGFGAQANPVAPPASEVLRYAPEEVDVVAHLDVEAVVPRNYEVFRKLATDPMLRDVPQAQRAIGEAVAKAENELAEVKRDAGIDLVHDVKSVTLFVAVREQGPPSFVVATRGKFPKDFPARIPPGKRTGWKPETVGGRPGLLSNDGMALATLAADGTLLVGTPAWVRERAGAWTPRGAGVGADVRAALDEKPIFLLASRPRPEAARLYEKQIADPEAAVARDFLTGHESAIWAVAWNGVSWSYTARTAAGYQRAVLATDGLIQLMRAGQLTLRGLARVGLAVVDSYAADPTLGKVARHKADLLRIVDTWSGEGNFTATVERKEGERRVSARLVGKSLSEVLPVAGLAILGVIGAAVAR